MVVWIWERVIWLVFWNTTSSLEPEIDGGYAASRLTLAVALLSVSYPETSLLR